jgi:hypothetical protein
VNDDAAARTCIAQVRQMTTSCSVDPIAWSGTDFGPARDPCRYVFGPTPQGAPCEGPYDALSCAPGFTCHETGPRVGYATLSHCEGPFPPRSVGSPCETVLDCEPAGYCEFHGTSPTTLPSCTLFLRVGQTCTTGPGTATGACVGEAYCDPTTSLCQPKLPGGSLSGYDPHRCASGNAFNGRCLANAYQGGPSPPGMPYSACLDH